MPDPVVVVAMREFKRGLLAREDAQMREMANQWITVEHRLTDLIENLATDMYTRQVNGELATRGALYRLQRYKRLRAQARDETTKYAEWADGTLTRYQDGSIDLALDQSAAAIQLSYWPGVGAYFDRLPREAVENLAGYAGDGKPLGDLLRRRMVNEDQDTWQRLVDNLVRGTALGENPRKVAKRMRDDLAGGLNKALVIARTEGLRPYREVSRSQYEKSGMVTGQKRLCAHDGRVCGACLADEGTVYDLQEVISDHPNGRCTSVPIVRGMPETTWTSGQAWFDQQPEDVQLSILGKGKLDAYRSGLFDFGNLVRRTDDPTWGKGLTPRSLADLLSGGRDSGAPVVDLRGPTPKGPPVSRGLKTPTRGKYKDIYQTATDAIDSVHGDGELPELPVKTVRSMSNRMGGFTHTTGRLSGLFGESLEAEKITINSTGEHMEFTFLHEVGHFLDFQVIGGFDWGSTRVISEGQLMHEWGLAIQNSKAVQTLLEKYQHPDKYEVEISERGYTSRPDKNHIRYLLNTKELWARSYAQYIAEESGNQTLLEQLGKERQDKLYGERHWDRDDFEPIRKTINDMFESLGWKS